MNILLGDRYYNNETRGKILAHMLAHLIRSFRFFKIIS